MCKFISSKSGNTTHILVQFDPPITNIVVPKRADLPVRSCEEPIPCTKCIGKIREKLSSSKYRNMIYPNYRLGALHRTSKGTRICKCEIKQALPESRFFRCSGPHCLYPSSNGTRTLKQTLLMNSH